MDANGCKLMQTDAIQLQINCTMATIKLYLDTRRANAKGEYPLKLAINKKGKTALISMNISVPAKCWDKASCKVVNHPNKAFYNNFIASRMLDADRLLLRLREEGKVAYMSVTELKEAFMALFEPTQEDKPKDLLLPYMEAYISRIMSEGTKAVYTTTYNHLIKFCELNGYKDLRFGYVNKSMLVDFDNYMSVTAKKRNARLVNLRNLRAIFNAAIDDEITTHYPFRRFDLSPEPTQKRNLSVDMLRRLFSYADTDNRPHVRKYVLFAKLAFLLIGINFKDLCYLTKDNIQGGRLAYSRFKTKKLYNIKVEKEAMEIIEELKGNDYLLYVLDTNTDHRFFLKHLNQTLQRLGTDAPISKPIPENAPYAEVTTYWLRHSWATIAHKIGIQKDTISLALGHSSGIKVTDTYIEYDMSKVDEANRRVIDYVFYGKL